MDVVLLRRPIRLYGLPLGRRWYRGKAIWFKSNFDWNLDSPITAPLLQRALNVCVVFNSQASTCASVMWHSLRTGRRAYLLPTRWSVCWLYGWNFIYTSPCFACRLADQLLSMVVNSTFEKYCKYQFQYFHGNIWFIHCHGWCSSISCIN